MSLIGAVLGVPEAVSTTLGIASRLAVGARRIDDRAAERMVDLMRGRVPRDSGLLFSGIRAERRENGWRVLASASRVSAAGKEKADYASFVEDGTQPGSRARGAKRRRAATDAGLGHSGTDAQAFFWPSVREVMAWRGEELRQFGDDLAADF